MHEYGHAVQDDQVPGFGSALRPARSARPSATTSRSRVWLQRRRAGRLRSSSPASPTGTPRPTRSAVPHCLRRWTTAPSTTPRTSGEVHSDGRDLVARRSGTGPPGPRRPGHGRPHHHRRQFDFTPDTRSTTRRSRRSPPPARTQGRRARSARPSPTAASSAEREGRSGLGGEDPQRPRHAPVACCVATTREIRSERFPDLEDEVLFPRLSDAKLAWLAKRGERRTFQPGEVLYEHAVRDAPFYVIERGLVEFVDRKPGKDVYIAQADSRTFIGDIAAFTGEPTISACVAVEPTDVIAFDRAGLRDMVARWPEFGEHIFRTLLARRAWHEAEGHGIMRLIAARGSRRAFEVRDLLERNLLPVRWYDVDTDEESAALLEWLDIPRSETPVLVHATQRDAQPIGRAGRAVAGAARRGRRRALRPGRARRRARRAWRPRSTAARKACARSWPRPGARRPGGHEHPDRELPRLPERDLRDRAHAQGDAAGPPLRRGPVELSPGRRAGRWAGGTRPRRPRRRPARARPVGS